MLGFAISLYFNACQREIIKYSCYCFVPLLPISLWQINAFIAFWSCIYCGACVAFELNQPAIACSAAGSSYAQMSREREDTFLSRNEKMRNP